MVMPTLDPRFAGFITSGNLNFFIKFLNTANSFFSHSDLFTIVKSGTKSPQSRNKLEDFILSIPKELAKIPEPVYGMHKASKKPCAVPSSPNSPCIAINATSVLIFAILSKPFPCFETIIGLTLYLFLSSAFKITFPVSSDTSRSEEGPPMRRVMFIFLFFIFFKRSEDCHARPKRLNKLFRLFQKHENCRFLPIP